MTGGLARTLATWALAAGLLAASNVVCAQIPCEYEVTAIIQAPECPPFGFPPTIGKAITEPINGGLPNVVGHYQSCVIGPDKAFLWIGNEDRFITIPMPAGTTQSLALSIHGSKVVGWHVVSGDKLGHVGFLYDYEADQFTSLGTLRGGNTSEARAINSAGEIVGFWGNSIKGNPGSEAFVWENGRMFGLGADLCTPESGARGIDSAGRITGWMGLSPNIDSHAFIWADGAVLDLGVIPGGLSADPFAINDRLEVVGRGVVNDLPFTRHAFVWAEGRMIDIGTLPGFEESAALDINDSRMVVGASEDPGLRAFVWYDGVMTDLNTLVAPELGITIKVARSINNDGRILSWGIGHTGTATFLLSPTDSLLGDLDGDCQVGAADLLILLINWGSCNDCNRCIADLDNDCVVGASDLLILLVNWG